MTQRLRVPATLPPVTGWVARFFGLLWVSVLAITLVGVLGGAWYQLQEGAGSAYGLDTLGINIASNMRIDRVGSDEARLAGVRIGDQVLSVEGITVPAGGPDIQFIAEFKRRAGEAGASVRIILRTGQAAPRAIVLTRSFAHSAALYAGSGLTPVSLTWGSVIAGLLAPTALVLGSTLLFGRRRDAVAALLSISLLGIATGASFAGMFWRHHTEAASLSTILPGIGFIGLMLAMQVFPNGRLTPRWTIYLMGATPVAFAAGALWPSLATIFVVTVLLSTLLAMVLRYRREMPEARRQWRWAMIGFVIGMLLMTGGALLYNAYLDRHQDFETTLWSWIVTPLILAIPLTIIVAGVVLSVLRYRLYDTQAAVSRSILLGVLTLTLLAIFTGSEKIIELVGERYFDESMGSLAGAMGAAFAAVAIVPLHHRLSHWVEHRFRKNLIHLRHDLPPLLTELGETSDPNIVALATLDHLEHGLHATRGAVIAKGHVIAVRGIDASDVAPPSHEEAPARVGTLRVQKRDPLFPLHIPLAADNNYWLLLGARPDASLYDRQERELLSDIAGPLAQALRVSDDRTRREAIIDARFDRIERELCALRAGRNLVAPAE